MSWNRQRAAPLLPRARESLDDGERNRVRGLAVVLHELGLVQRELGLEACVASFEEALELLESIGDRTAAAAAFNLGRSYSRPDAPRDLAKAAHWFGRSLKLMDEGDRISRGRVLGQLGFVAFLRFKEAQSRQSGEDELLSRLNEAVDFYHQALRLFPADAVDELAVSHNQLAHIYYEAGDVDRALPHLRDAIHYREIQGNIYGASQTRFNVALSLAGAERLQDALAYAKAALRGFETYGESAGEMLQRTRRLVQQIEEDLRPT